MFNASQSEQPSDVSRKGMRQRSPDPKEIVMCRPPAGPSIRQFHNRFLL